MCGKFSFNKFELALAYVGTFRRFQDDINQFNCNCTGTGYQGIICNEDIDECALDANKCGDGLCNNTIGGYKCVCNPQDETPMCGYNCNLTDPCSLGNLCENGGTCFEACNSVPDYTCQCPSGYIGKNCSQVRAKFFFFK